MEKLLRITFGVVLVIHRAVELAISTQPKPREHEWLGVMEIGASLKRKAMKRRAHVLGGLLVAIVALISHAAPVPKKLQKSLDIFSNNQSSLSNGVLQIRTTRSNITQVIFENWVELGACAAIWTNGDDGWSGATITRIEVLDENASRGFAFKGGFTECRALGKFKGGDAAAKRYIADRTAVIGK